MKLRAAAAENDIAWIMALERRPENSAFVSVNDGAEHQAFMAAPDSATLIFADSGGQPLGFAMLRGLTSPAGALELMRIVVAEPGRGIGGRFLRALIEHAFRELNAKRLWLDVFDDNARGRAAYRREGFVEEGLLRESALKTNGEIGSLVVMSILRREWQAPGRAAGRDTG